MKIVQKALFRSCAARFGQIAFLSVKFSRTSNWPEILFKTGKQFALHENCTKRSFQVTRSTFWRNRIFWASKFLKSLHLSQILFKTEKQCALHKKLYKTLFSGHAQHVLAKSHFWASKFSKSSHWTEILAKTGKEWAFHENCTKGSLQIMRSTFWPNRIFERQSSQNRHNGLNFP